MYVDLFPFFLFVDQNNSVSSDFVWPIWPNKTPKIATSLTCRKTLFLHHFLNDVVAEYPAFQCFFLLARTESTEVVPSFFGPQDWGWSSETRTCPTFAGGMMVITCRCITNKINPLVHVVFLSKTLVSADGSVPTVAFKKLRVFKQTELLSPKDTLSLLGCPRNFSINQWLGSMG